jgi:hypothetical protein
MPIDAQDAGLRMLHLVEVNLREHGITAQLDEKSLCLFRPVYDRPSATTYGMRSAFADLAQGANFARFYCIEQYDSSGGLIKFACRLTDADNTTVREWHMDISHGVHTHPVVAGKKSPEHIPYSGSSADLVRDIVAAIRGM